MMLVTLEQAKDHVNVMREDTTRDDILTLYVQAASGAVMSYLKSGVDIFLDSNGDLEYDTNDNVVGMPWQVSAAVLFMVGYLFKNRDENPDQAFQQGYLPAPVTALLYPLRDPAIA